MPQALIALTFIALKSVGVVIGSALLASVIATAVQLAVVLGISFIASQVFGKGGMPKPSDGQQIIRENVSSRRRHYGIVHVGGTMVFYESKNGALYTVVATGHGELDQVLEHRLNNEARTLDGSGYVTVTVDDGGDPENLTPFRIIDRLGTDDQTAISELTSVFSEWTTDHRLRGVSHTMLMFDNVEQKYFTEVYEGNQIPSYTKVAKASKLYDPRLDDTAGGTGDHRLADPSTWEWSDNAALVIGDYLAHTDGFGLGTDAVNWESIATEADICDEEVTTSDARTIARYRIWGSYNLSTDERRTVLANMLMACDGFIYQDAEGKACLQVGQWIEPTVTLTEDHIISVTASFGVDPTDRTNEVKVVYTDDRFDYTETESAPQRNEAEITRVGKTESQRFDVYFIPDHNQAARIGKRLLARMSERWNLTLVCNLYGLNLIGERFCKVTLDELGLTDVPFEVTSVKIDPAGNVIEVGVTEVTEDDFTFDAATEEGDRPAAPDDTSSPVVIEVPTGLLAQVVSRNVGGVYGFALKASWNATTRAGLIFDAQYREAGESAWESLDVNQEERTGLAEIVNSDATYEVRVRSISIGGRVSAWSDIATASSASISFDSDEATFDSDLITMDRD